MRQSYYPQQQQQSQYDSNHSHQNRNQQSQQQQQPQPQPPLTGAAARLANKQKEFQALKLLREHSNKMADDIEKLADQVDLLVKGGDSVADVLSGWQGVFRAIQIARADPSLLNQSQDPNSIENNNNGEKEDEKKRILPETLVRIPIEGDSSR